MHPSTLYYLLVKWLYSKGYRPKPGNPFYADVLEEEARICGKVHL